MTNEQAIKILSNATFSDEWQGNEDLTTAYLRYIQDRRQTMNNDLISRSALKILVEQTQIINPKLSVYDVLKIIDNAPTVDAIPNKEGYEMYNKGYMSGYEICKKDNEPKKGEWKIYKSPVNRYYQCSCCGKNSPDFTAYMKMNFCPNCGADMR